MNPLDITGAVAAEQIRDRTRLAHQAHLVALARCCRPSAWRHAARRAARTVAALRRGLRPTRRRAGVCCA